MRVRRKLWGKGDEAVFDSNVKEARRAANMLAAFCAGFGAVVVLLAFFVVRPAVNAPLSVVSDVTAPVKSSGLQFLYRFFAAGVRRQAQSLTRGRGRRRV